MARFDINGLRREVMKSDSAVSLWLSGIPVKLEKDKLSVLFTVRREMTSASGVARISVLASMAEEACMLYKINENLDDVSVDHITIQSKEPVSLNDSLLVKVRRHLLPSPHLRYRIVGKGRKTLAWGKVQCKL